jgi:hypothetical protein
MVDCGSDQGRRVWKPEAQQRTVEEFQNERTQGWGASGHLWMDTVYLLDLICLN